MRRLLGLLVLLYGLLLALNTTAPSLAELAGDKVTAKLSGRSAACTAPLGSPPFGGLYGNCPADWPGSAEGSLFGAEVATVLGDGEAADAFTYPLLADYAVLPPSNSDQVVAIIAVLIVLLGIMMLVSERKHSRSRRGSARSDGDSDDYDSSDSGSSDSGSSDSGGGDSGGGGD